MMTTERTDHEADEGYLKRWLEDGDGYIWTLTQVQGALRAAERRPESRGMIEIRASLREAADSLGGHA